MGAHSPLSQNRTPGGLPAGGVLARLPLWGLGAVLLAACGGDGTAQPKAFSPIESGAGPTLAQVVSRVDAGELRVHVRAVNEYRAAVPAGPLTVQIEGEAVGGVAQTVSVSPDALGHGVAVVPGSGLGASTVSVIDSTDGLDLSEASGESFAVADVPVDFKSGAVAFLPPLDDSPSFAASATEGVVFAVRDQVWFQPADAGQPAWMVLDMPQDVAGMEAGHVDADGVLDLLVWGGNQAVLLKGRSDGGYAWQGGWRAGFGTVAGGTLADIDSDRNTDVVLAASGDSQAMVVPFMGDGVWGFAEEEALFLSTEIYDVAAADEGHDGRPVISVLSVASSTVRRYTLSDRGWVGAATSELPGYAAQPDSTLLPMTDLNGDRTYETLILGAPEANTQDVVMFVIQPDGAGAVNYPVPLPPFHASVADVDLDGSLDILASVDDALHVIGWDGEGFADRRSEVPGERGPVAGSHLVHDEIPDIAVVTDAVTVYPGALSSDGEWQHERFSWRSFNTALQGPAIFHDFDGDGITDVLGFTTETDLVAASWTLGILDSGEGELQFQGRTENGELGDGAAPYAMVRCDTRVYALTEGLAGTQLSRIDVSTGAPVIDATADTSGTLLACGLLPSGEEGVVVAQQSGFWRSYGIGLTPKEEGTIEAVGAIALADTNGDGLGEVVGCPEAGCSVLALDPDGDGIDAVVFSDASGSRLLVDGAERALPGGGLLAAGDVDLDGTDDLVAWSPELGRGTIWQAAGTGVAPGRGFHNDRDLVSAPAIGDMTGDGVPELIFVDGDGKLWHSEASAR